MTVIFEDVLRDLVLSLNLTDRRVFLMRAPQKPAEQMTTPYIVFLPIGPEPLHSITAPIDVQISEYQFSTFDSSQSRALAVADALRSGLDGYRGDFEGVRFGGIFYVSKTTSYELNTKLFQVIQDFRILFQTSGALTATIATHR